MTVRELLATLQRFPRDAELLAFEPGCEDYCEREIDEVEWQGGRLYLHLGARRDDRRDAKRGSLVPVTGWGLPWQDGGMRPTAYRRNARGLRDRQAFEHIRMQAGALFAAGHAQAEVARTLGVARQNVSRWHALWRSDGLDALATRGPTGPTPRLSDAQLNDLEQALRQGARAHGFDTDHWTLARITTVIGQTTGTRYHPGHTWKLLRRMGWRLQRPARRAVERDEQAIARWVAEDWP